VPETRRVDDARTPLRGLASVPDVAGDHLNAQRFLEANGDKVRRSPELNCYYLWDGAWWREDRLDRVLDLAGECIDDLRTWVAESEGADEFKRRSAHYTVSAKAGRRDALLSIVGTDPTVVVSIDQLDAHPMLLACRNGTVDLRTGELRPARQSDLLTRGVDVEYDADADSSKWDEFITTIFENDLDLVAFMQRLLGYCITGTVKEHVLPVFHGAGANGKSVLTGVVQDILGHHAMTAPDGLVIRHDHEPHPERIAALRGRRLVVSNELEERAVLAEQTVKQLTGGDTLSARELYGRRFNFQPTHKVLLVSNHKPKVKGTDHAIWRRIRLVPFNYIIPADKQDVDLRRRLVEEHGPAVLAWLVRGARLWHSEGLGSATAVDTATEDYRGTQDTFGTFLEECTVMVPNTRTKVGELFAIWRSWCDRTGERPGRIQDFSAALEDHGLILDTYKNAKSVLHLGIVAQAPEQGQW